MTPSTTGASPVTGAGPAQLDETCDTRTYSNLGNGALLELLPDRCRRILDVGCGTGDNAARLLERDPGRYVVGLTLSAEERAASSRVMARCLQCDVEARVPPELLGERFDAMLFSHVLEHLRDPVGVLRRFLPLLERGGVVLIAVPNMLVWQQRLAFLRGRFRYTASGIMDNTHVRFFTFETAAEYLVAPVEGLRLDVVRADGYVPQGIVRKVLPRRASAWLDRTGSRLFPNLLGWQVVLRATRA